MKLNLHRQVFKRSMEIFLGAIKAGLVFYILKTKPSKMKTLFYCDLSYSISSKDGA